MTPNDSVHLSEEELNDILIGLGSSESEAHLNGCRECRARVREFQSELELFNSASMAWSESRAVKPIQPTSREGLVHPRLALLSWAATAAVVLVMAVAIWHHGHSAPADHAAAMQSQPSDSEAQIAEDNQLLQEVNAAISPDEESLIEQYKLSEAPRVHEKTRPKLRKQ